MKLLNLISCAMLAASTAAHPVGHSVGLSPRQANSSSVSVSNSSNVDIDITILQFALTLEHLENVFYKSGLASFSEQDFLEAGFSSDFFIDLTFIAEDEQSHVVLLTEAIQAAGQTPVAACQYHFPVTDVQSFVTLSSVLESVGTSAYLGGASLISSTEILTVAASILVTESLHTSLQRSAINEVAAASPNGTPLGPNSVFSLAAAFIVSCPDSNPPLPFTAFPSLTLGGTSSRSDGEISVGHSQSQGDSVIIVEIAVETIIILIIDSSASIGSSGSYVTFVSGLNVTSVAASVDGSQITAPVPKSASGQTYVFITNVDVSGQTLSDEVILFGPTIIEVVPAPPSIDFSIL